MRREKVQNRILFSQNCHKICVPKCNKEFMRCLLPTCTSVKLVTQILQISNKLKKHNILPVISHRPSFIFLAVKQNISSKYGNLISTCLHLSMTARYGKAKSMKDIQLRCGARLSDLIKQQLHRNAVSSFVLAILEFFI